MRKVDELGLHFLETTVRSLRSEKGPAPSLLWHYTSGSGLLGILQSREIWSTHYTCLNDEAELNAGFKLAANLINLYGQKFQRKEHVQTLLAQMKRLLLGEILPELKQPPFGFPESFLGEHYECFVTSFSEENDDLAQWRAYGSGEGGYALGFEPEIVDHVSNTPPLGSVSLVPVLYHADEQHKLLFKFLNAVVDALEQDLEDQNAPYRGGREAVVLEHARDAVVMFSYIAPIFKHRTFRGEREWRIIMRPNAGTISDSVLQQMKFVPKQTVLSRHISLKLSPGSLKEIKVGPSRYRKSSVASVEHLLRQKSQRAGVRVSASDAPFRTV